MAYMILDEETQTHHSRKRKANPFDVRNYIVMRGFKVQGAARNTMQYFRSKEEVTDLDIPDHVDILVGHNIKFDLLYEMCVSPSNRQKLIEFFARGGRIFDTQYAKYLIEGQVQKYQMCAMDDIIEEYGGRKKVDGIKELWKAGVLTSDINPDLLEDYLIGTEEEGRNSGDIGNTELLYLGMLKEIKEKGMEAAVWARMDGLAATTEMEFNGLKIDIDRAKADMQQRMDDLAKVKAELKEHISFIPDEVQFNWGSNVHKSCLIFGGTISYKKQDTYLDEDTGELARLKAKEAWPLFRGEPKSPSKLAAAGGVQSDEGLWSITLSGNTYTQDTYLSGKKVGQPKTKQVDVPGELKVKYQNFFYKLDGLTTPKDEWKGSLTDGMGGPVYGTGSDIIEELGVTTDIPFLKAFSLQQAILKELGTYYMRYDEKKKEHVGMLTCVDPVSHMVNHSLNHTSTITTRLSSSNPNMQNIPRSDGGKSAVKAMFVSRFGDDGVMAELDYSQLEVVIQGWLSGDPNLVKDLIAKIDFHCKRVSAKFGITYEEALDYCKNEENGEVYKVWKPRRTGVKEFSFQRAYGAGAAAIAAATGLPLADVQELIINEDKMYPGIGKFNEAVEREVNQTAEPFRDPELGYRQFRRGTYQAPTGTIYSFRSWDAPEFMRKRGVTDTFKPPELKNYPMQGTGGEVVQMVLGKLWRWFMKNRNWDGKALLVNTVHDCVWADMMKEVMHIVIPGMHVIMEAVPHWLKQTFGLDCPVPFPVEAECGPNMIALKHYKQENT